MLILASMASSSSVLYLRELAHIFWLKNMVLGMFGHLEDTIRAVWKHVLFIYFLLIYFTLESLATIHFEWVEFFTSEKLQHG